LHGTIVSAGIFAVGSRCGKVILYDVNSLEQQEVIQIHSKFYHNKKNNNITDNCNYHTTTSSTTTTNNKSSSSTDDSNDQQSNGDDKYHHSTIQSITSLLFGKLLLIKHSNCYDFSIIHLRSKNSHTINITSKLSSIFMPSLVSSLTSPLYYKYINNNTYSSSSSRSSSSSNSGTYNEYQDASVIASCVGHDQIFCIIRKHSNVLEFYFIDSHDNNTPKNYLNVSIKTLSYNHQHQQQKDYHYQSHHSNQQSHHQYNDHLYQKSSSSSYFPTVTMKNYDNKEVKADDDVTNITIISCHVIISDRTYVISILGKLNKNHLYYNDHHNQYIYNQIHDQSLYLFSGSITLPHLPHITAMTIIKYLLTPHLNKHGNYNNSTLNNNDYDNNNNAYFNDKSSNGNSNKDINEHQDKIDFHPYVTTLKQRILIDDYVNNNETTSSSTSSSSPSSLSSSISNNYSFYGHYCAITTNDDIYVIDLLKVYISPIGVLINTVCLSIIPSSLSMIGINSNWFDSTILLTSDDNNDDDDEDDDDDDDCDGKHNIDRNVNYNNHVNDYIYDNKKRIQAIIFNKKNKTNNCNLTTKDFDQHHHDDEEEDHLNNNKSTINRSYSLSSSMKSLYTKSLKLIVHRKYRGALLKFRIKCSK
jgi:hypothetical protein